MTENNNQFDQDFSKTDILDLNQGRAIRDDVTMLHQHYEGLVMASIVQFLSKDHDLCDDLFFQTESNVSKGRWELAIVMYRKFKAALERHLAIEEKILFPALGDVSGNTCGPTAVMRSEHQQIRQIVQDLDSAINMHDAEEFLGNSETLNIMMQQHNFKEENMLYVMADQQLAGRREEIISAMEGIQELA